MRNMVVDHKKSASAAGLRNMEDMLRCFLRNVGIRTHSASSNVYYGYGTRSWAEEVRMSGRMMVTCADVVRRSDLPWPSEF